MTTRIPAARAAALQAVLVERERQDAKHGFDPIRPTGFGRWWAPWVDRALHWLYERAARRGQLTWAHTLAEEVGEVLAAQTPSEAVKELREVAAVCVKVEEALVARGDIGLPGFVQIVGDSAGMVVRRDESMAHLPRPCLITSDMAVAAFREYAAGMPRESRTAADCQALLGASEVLQRLGVSGADLAAVENPAELGATIARLTRALPPTGGVQ